MAKLVDGQYFEQIEANPALVSADSDLTQLVTVTTAGTPVQGPAKTNGSGWYLKALVTNAGTMYFMFWGQTAAAKGFPLSAGDLIYVPVSNLSSLGFDATVNGEKVICTKA